ncbi:hypothetical protein [Shewanella salipaludis]|uniref:CopL family metal-binding regulatory protein n=1 Tax=Shewanella salipaludis TaxID=2723052 RepID=A0A972JMF1_9GAMM|nr:hypothetical protein [Shewanella salipaludis]NMH65046.1 hypothetical protein [Shewanella salipaludis]
MTRLLGRNPGPTRSILILITLLAMLGQGLMASAFALTPDRMNMSPATAMSMPAMTAMSQTQAMDCDPDSQVAADCCRDEAMQAQTSRGHQDACDSGCQHDCSHCLSFTVTASLLPGQYWHSCATSTPAIPTPLAHFHSIPQTQAFRPPIA